MREIVANLEDDAGGSEVCVRGVEAGGAVGGGGRRDEEDHGRRRRRGVAEQSRHFFLPSSHLLSLSLSSGLAAIVYTAELRRDTKTSDFF